MRRNAQFAVALLRERDYEEYDHIYLVDAENHLTGQVPLRSLIRALPEVALSTLKGKAPVEVTAAERAERAALLAIENHDADVAVIDSDRRLVGSVPVERLLTLLHKRHIDNMLRHGGLDHRHHFLLDAPTLVQGVRVRLPWLILGLGGGILMGAVASIFESSMRLEVRISFFLPLVVYMSDAIGTQTETLLIRRMAARTVSARGQIMLEAATGVIIGSIIGLIASITLYFFIGNPLAMIIGWAVFASAATASFIASCFPLLLSAKKADPAAASGPVATVIQDFLGVTIYLGIAALAL